MGKATYKVIAKVTRQDLTISLFQNLYRTNEFTYNIRCGEYGGTIRGVSREQLDTLLSMSDVLNYLLDKEQKQLMNERN